MRSPFNYRFGLPSPFYDNETGFSPSALFSVAGSRGFFYDFSDYTTQFTDTLGTAPVTGTGQSPALVLDESQGLAAGPELVTNGDFSDGTTGWVVGAGSFTITDGLGRLENTSAAASYAYTAVATIAGRTYRLNINAFSGTTTGNFRIGTTTNGTEILSTTAVLGNLPRYFVATSSLTYITIRTASAVSGEFCDFDNISVRELPGNHATQATAGSRALTQVRPMFTQRNRAVGSELPENATYWRQGSVTSGGVTLTILNRGIDPADGLPFYEFRAQGTPSATSVGFTYVTPDNTSIAAVQGQTVTTSVILQRTGGTTTGVTGMRLALEEKNNLNVTVAFDVSSDFTGTEPAVVSYTKTLANAATVRAITYPYLAVVIGVPVDVTFRIKAFQFERGSTRTTYQPAVSGERRNLMPTSGNPVLWSGGVGTVNGITVARVATGFDAAGLPYADYSVSGTATANDVRGVAGVSESRRPAIAGQTFTSSVVIGLISGSAPPAGSGVYTEVAEENSSNVYLAGTSSVIGVPATDTLRTVTRTLSDPALAVTRGGVIILTLSGATVNYTVRIKAPQFEQNATYSRYQQTITANEWYEPGFTSYRGIRFDGTDDFLQTAAIDFSNSDKMTVVAGVRKLSDAATGTVVELSANPDTTNGSFGMRAPAGANSYVFRAFGTVGPVAVALTGFAAPESAVITGSGDISADSTVIRRNGAAGASLGTDLGTGNYSNSPVFIGRGFGGTTNPFNGILTFLCVINRTLTEAELAQLEAFANSRTGAYT